MTGFEKKPSAETLDEVRRLAGPTAVVRNVTRLEGGQHAETWRVETDDPPTSVVVRQFPHGDPAPVHERRVLRALDGLGGLTPMWLAGDLDGLSLVQCDGCSGSSNRQDDECRRMTEPSEGR